MSCMLNNVPSISILKIPLQSNYINNATTTKLHMKTVFVLNTNSLFCYIDPPDLVQSNFFGG